MTPEEIVKAAMASEVVSKRYISYAAINPDGSATGTVHIRIEPDAIERLQQARESRSETR